MTGNTRKVSLKPKTEDRAQEVSERPKRQSLKESYRNILTVDNKDPNYEYRWINDTYAKSDDQTGAFYPGQRIMRFQNAGWEFVTNKDVTVGDSYVYKTGNVGSIIRAPGGQGDMLYLMKIHKDWYDEDQATKQEYIDKVEDAMGNPKQELGQYGNVSTDWREIDT